MSSSKPIFDYGGFKGVIILHLVFFTNFVVLIGWIQVMKKILKIFEFFVVIFLLMYIFYFSGVNNIEFHGDESQWIATSVVFEVFLSGDFHSSIWNESHWMLTQPHLPRYIIGLGRWFCGIDESELNHVYDWSVDYETNKERGNVPSPQLLRCSRFSMEILSAISICIAFFLLKRMGGYFPALVWLILILFSNYFPLMLGRAMGESSLLASITLFMLMSYLLLEETVNSVNPIKIYSYMFLFGLGVGLAGSSKLNGFSLLASGFLLSIIIAHGMNSSTKSKIKFIFISNLIFVFSSLATWIAINPFLWPSPFYRTLKMFNYRVMEMTNQVELFPFDRIKGVLPRIKVLIKRIFQSYASIRFKGSWIINLFLFSVGFISLLVKSIKDIKVDKSNHPFIVIFIIGLTSSLPALITPLDWDRYYLFPIYFTTIGIAIGIWKIFTFFRVSLELLIKRIL